MKQQLTGYTQTDRGTDNTKSTINFCYLDHPKLRPFFRVKSLFFRNKLSLFSFSTYSVPLEKRPPLGQFQKVVLIKEVYSIYYSTIPCKFGL